MRRLLALFALIAMSLSLGVAPVAHAMERPSACSEAEAAAHAFDFDGESQPAPADSDKDYPHHHGSCHGHHIAAPFEEACEIGHSDIAPVHAAVLDAADASTVGDPALRPPQA